MTTLRLSKNSAAGFKPQVGLGSTASLNTKRQYPIWRRWMAGIITGTCAVTIVGAALFATMA